MSAAGLPTRAGRAWPLAETELLKIGRGALAPPFRVMDMITAANTRQAALAPGAPHVLRMEVGQPGAGAPAGAVEAAVAALRGGSSLGYTEALGRPSLRARIARHAADWYGHAPDPAGIAITMGASAAFPLAFLAAFDPGDRVALTAPYYPPYVNILTALGLVPVILQADGFGCEEVREGPVVLVRGGKVYLIYSICDTGKPDYKLGMLTADAKSNLLDPASWKQHPNRRAPT